jgi:predicted phosphoribosyltransferase
MQPTIRQQPTIHQVGAPPMVDLPFLDRHDAGRQLAACLNGYRDRPDLVVLALPRGGVPVAYEVAARLAAPLDVFVVRKLGVPGHEELAMGAVASGGVRVLNEQVVRAVGVRPEQVARATDEQLAVVAERERSYRDGRPPPAVDGRTVILVDDGLATGATMRAAIEALRRQRTKGLVVAVPVAAAAACAELRPLVDDVVCAATPADFTAVGLWYRNFAQPTDDAVRDLLARARAERTSRADPAHPTTEVRR